jgi:hypothetical protein
VPRIRIGPALPDRKSLDAEIARLRDLGVNELRSRWHTVFGRQPPPHLPRHLLFRVLVYRLQADQLVLLQLIWPRRVYVLVLRTSGGEVDAVVLRNKEFVSNVQRAVEQAFVVRARQPL